MDKFENRLDEYIKKNEAKKQEKSVLLWMAFFVAITLTFFMAFDLEADFSITSLINALLVSF